MTGLIPSGPADLTNEWLNAVLAADLGDIGITSVTSAPIGTGQTGATYRLSVTYDGAQNVLPPTFVAKIPVADIATRKRVALGCKAEVAFYQDVAETLGVSTPTCYSARVEDDGAQFVLLLADLAPANQGDQLAGCSPSMARFAVEELARLHGPRWCDPKWLDFTDSAMPRADERIARSMAKLARTATDQFCAEMGGQMTSANRSVLDRFPDEVADWLLLFPQRFSLIHGDYRLDNLMFDPNNQQVTVVDWQTITVGLPARDLSYFLSTSLSPQDRRDHEWDLVGAYHSALLASGVTDYDLSACEQDYRIGMLQGPLISTFGWAFSATTERGNAMMLVMLDRCLEAIRDLGSLPLVQTLATK